MDRSNISIANSSHNSSDDRDGDDSTAAFIDTFCSSQSSLGLGYSYLQQRYWGVGFMQYYQWKQVPNFLLALPITYIAIRTIVSQCYTLYGQVCGCGNSSRGYVEDDDDSKAATCSINTARNVAAAMTLHLLATLTVGLLWANVQITTRLICSSCPIIYVGMACILTGSYEMSRDARAAGTPHSVFRFSIIGYAVAWYVLVYNIVGVLLHTNYYPWT